MADPAARVDDNHLCPCPDPNAHVGGPILPPCSPTAEVNDKPQARATDQAECTGVNVNNFIVTGSGTVLVNGLPAARMGDRTMHPPPGVITEGSPDVLIGGPTVGATLGDPDAGRAACVAAAGGRTSGRTQQSYSNCGIESARQVINQATGANVSEDDLLDEAMDNDWATEEKDDRRASGGTSPAGRQDILEDNGVPSSLVDNSVNNITQAVAEGRGVITSHEVETLWGNGQRGGHAILVTGVEYDADGNPVNFIVNDTGLGICENVVPADDFVNSLRPGRQVNVTDNPIW